MTVRERVLCRKRRFEGMSAEEEPLPRTKQLLQGRQVEVKNGYVTVTYPRSLCSKNQAWQHLCSRPPPEVGKFRQHADNPWTKHHGSDGWSWSSPSNGVELKRQEGAAEEARLD